MRHLAIIYTVTHCIVTNPYPHPSSFFLLTPPPPLTPPPAPGGYLSSGTKIPPRRDYYSRIGLLFSRDYFLLRVLFPQARRAILQPVLAGLEWNSFFSHSVCCLHEIKISTTLHVYHNSFILLIGPNLLYNNLPIPNHRQRPALLSFFTNTIISTGIYPCHHQTNINIHNKYTINNKRANL